MNNVELRRLVADRLIALHTALGRLSDVRLAQAFRREAAPYFAWSCSWSSGVPTAAELSAALDTVERLLRSVARAQRPARPPDDGTTLAM